MCAAVALGGCGEPIDRTQEAVEVSSTQSIVPLSLGGPVILGGDDLTDHGGYNPSTGQLLAGWIYIKKALQNIHSSVTRSNDGTVAVLGSANSTATSADAGGAYHYATPQAGMTAVFYDGPVQLENFFNALRAGTVHPAIIVAVGTDANNDLEQNEGVVLANNAVTMADFVNSGGGLLSHGYGPIAYGWLTTLLPGIVEGNGCTVETLSLTADGQAAFPGLTNNDIRAGPCHSHFSGNLGNLKVLARDGSQLNIIIGGAAVQLPGTITLTPQTVTYVVGVTTSHTVTAKVQDGSLNPVVGVTVTFTVNSGPNAGNTGTAVTNAQGQASFTYPSNGATGTDNITASYVDNGTVRTTPTVQAIWIEPPNRAPTAIAGGPYTTPEGSSVSLSGSASFDPDGDPITYAWDLDNDGAYDDAIGPTASFFGVDGPSTHPVGLKVCDNHGACGTAATTVTVINVAPTANAGADQTVSRSAPVSLSGTFTDPAGAADNAYAWSWDLNGDGVPDASGSATYGSAIVANTHFPSAGTYTLTFRVTDKDGGSHSDTVVITVINRPPVANAGGPYSTPEGSSVSLNGGGSSDPDGDALTYAWDLDDDGAYDDATGPAASFFGVDGPSVHTVGLKVCDSGGACGTATTTVTVINVAPTANAGADQTVFRNATVSLAGTFTDPAGAADNPYAWSWDLDGDGVPDAAGSASYGSAVPASTSFPAAGTYALTFRVTDKDGGAHGDTVVITVINRPPVANAGGPYGTPEGSSASLDGSASSDPDGDTLTYAWDLDNDGAYDDASGPTASFFGVDGPSVHTVGLKVCDPDGACNTAATTVTVANVAPTANAGADQTVFRNATVSLSGTFTDPAGAADDAYVWSWDLNGDGVPDATGLTSYGSAVSASASFPAAGTYTLTFWVTDKDGGASSDTVVITVVDQPPDCSLAAPSIALLWPPNHQMVDVTINGVTDPDGDPVTVTITSIFQDEPVDDIADGHTSPDGAGVGTGTASVRAERSGSKKNYGNGRVYQIGFTATDGDLSCSGKVAVGVPHDQGGQPFPVDDGALYDSTAP